tara:strand:- start:547 stop:1638 length:1092 start_codon:yes stop_codon:yes gene_type:complete
MDFDILYGNPSSGDKIKQWKIFVTNEKNEVYIIRQHGFVEHKISESKKHIQSGKNIGKQNETTALEQAIKEAKSLYKKQLENGYTKSLENLNKQTLLPMLAHDFNKRGKDITFPCYIQPKLDGVRLMITMQNDEIKMISRTGKEINVSIWKHIIKKVSKHLKNGLWLDGEIFSFEIPFEEITGAFHKKTKPEYIENLNFYIFDCFDENVSGQTFDERLKFLKTCNLNLVTTEIINKNEELNRFHERYISDGFEGVMLRNKDGIYKSNYRSKDLQKYKTFCDEEFTIVGGQEATGNDSGTIIFMCETKDKHTFKVRPKGTREYRKQLLENIDQCIGKQLTVRYQNMTEHNIPRFPVGIAIRDYE